MVFYGKKGTIRVFFLLHSILRWGEWNPSHFYADEYDAWNAKIGFVPHSVFSSPCSSILLCMLCCTSAEYRPRFQKRIDISCGIYGIAYCYFLEKKRLLSCWAVRATFTPLLAALDHGKVKKGNFFVKSGQNQKLIFFISIYLDSVVSLISIHLQKFETNQEFCILFYTKLYSCFLLFSPLKACNFCLWWEEVKSWN